MFMLDTNTCIYIIKKHPPSVLKHFEKPQLGDICISSVTFAELLYGVEKSQHRQKNKAALEEFILPLEILCFDEDAASHYGSLRTYLERKGTPIGAMDLMIAAHAQAMQSVLVTNNKKEFLRIPDLKMEDWVHH